MQGLVQAVKDHALANYEEDGWDYIVECWTDSEIAEAIKGCKTPLQAIRRIGKTARLLDERRQEVCAEAF